jgi:prepilin-type N-terminal cleavage/methylation domain-containing protein
VLRRIDNIRLGPRGFTLIEILATLLVVGVVLGLVVPRVRTTERRQAENSVRAAAQLVAIAAQRASTSSEVSALVYDHEEGTLHIEVLREQRGNYDRTERVWRRDAFAPSVTLTGCRISEMVSDGSTIREQSFRIVFEQGVARPQISMSIAQATGSPVEFLRDGRSWRIDMPSYALRPVVTGLITDVPGASVPQPIDLDALGRVNQSW